MDHVINLILVSGAGLAGYRYPVRLRAFLAHPILPLAGLLAAIAVLGIYGLAIIFYIAYPDYADHIQPQIVSVAWLAMHGKPIYPDWTKGDAYGMLYGPLTYYVNGVFLLLFGPGFFTSKLAGLIAGLASPCIMAVVLKKKNIVGYILFFFAALFIAELLSGDFYSYGVSGDSFLLLLAVLALGAFGRRPLAGGVYIGIIAGLSVGFKIHGFLYTVPVILGLLAGSKNKHVFYQTAGGMGVAFSAALLVVHHSPSLVGGYWQYLLVTSHHFLIGMNEGSALGSTLDFLIKDLWLALFFAAAPLLLGFWLKPHLTREEKGFAIGLVLASIGVAIIASKPGSGPHHMLPLIPAYMYLVALMLKAPSAKRHKQINAEGLMALILAMNFLFFSPQGFAFDLRQYDMHPLNINEAKIAEMKKFIKLYPEAQIGVTDYTFYPNTYYRPIAVFQGAPLHLDLAAWIDLSYGGVPDDVILWTVSGCHVPAWIFPQDMPFSIINPYTKAFLFSDRFRQTFFANYKPAKQGRYYVAWVCK